MLSLVCFAEISNLLVVTKNRAPEPQTSMHESQFIFHRILKDEIKQVGFFHCSRYTRIMRLTIQTRNTAPKCSDGCLPASRRSEPGGAPWPRHQNQHLPGHAACEGRAGQRRRVLLLPGGQSRAQVAGFRSQRHLLGETRARSLRQHVKRRQSSATVIFLQFPGLLRNGQHDATSVPQTHCASLRSVRPPPRE